MTYPFLILIDIKECKDDDLHNCSQVCIELEGDFSCACYGGYELSEDGVSCNGMSAIHINLNNIVVKE